MTIVHLHYLHTYCDFEVLVVGSSGSKRSYCMKSLVISWNLTHFGYSPLRKILRKEAQWGLTTQYVPIFKKVCTRRLHPCYMKPKQFSLRGVRIYNTVLFSILTDRLVYLVSILIKVDPLPGLLVNKLSPFVVLGDQSFVFLGIVLRPGLLTNNIRDFMSLDGQHLFTLLSRVQLKMLSFNNERWLHKLMLRWGRRESPLQSVCDQRDHNVFTWSHLCIGQPDSCRRDRTSGHCSAIIPTKEEQQSLCESREWYESLQGFWPQRIFLAARPPPPPKLPFPSHPKYQATSSKHVRTVDPDPNSKTPVVP